MEKIFSKQEKTFSIGGNFIIRQMISSLPDFFFKNAVKSFAQKPGIGNESAKFGQA